MGGILKVGAAGAGRHTCRRGLTYMTLNRHQHHITNSITRTNTARYLCVQHRAAVEVMGGGGSILAVASAGGENGVTGHLVRACARACVRACVRQAASAMAVPRTSLFLWPSCNAHTACAPVRPARSLALDAMRPHDVPGARPPAAIFPMPVAPVYAAAKVRGPVQCRVCPGVCACVCVCVLYVCMCVCVCVCGVCVWSTG